MSRLKKIGIITISVLAILVLTAWLFLFIDNPYPDVDTDDLTITLSSAIPKGQATEWPGDSVHKNITSKGEWFTDRTGRTMILHGINVAGNTKVPYTPRIASHIKENFYETVYTASFVGRPFPINQADDHFKRLHQWGYRFIRLLITWEGIEHAGPDNYDEDYLNYIQAIVRKAGEHDLNVFIDPHQDVWSRFSGGDGAPYWTLEKVGFDPLKFTDTGAAIIHNVEGDPFPKMIWPTNYSKLGSATMFTLFFGGDVFAPRVRIDSLSAQAYLQQHYINAVRQVALKLKGMPNVIGFDTFNEPSVGYIGNSKLDSLGLLVNGVMPTPFQGMAAGGGNTVEVSEFEFRLQGAKEIQKIQLNPARVSAWRDPSLDIWRQAGVWGYDANDQPVLLQPDYFVVQNGKRVNFSEDFFKPFALRFQKAIHDIDSTWLIFAEPALLTELPQFSEEESRAMVNATHWYDFLTLITKEYSSWVGVDLLKKKPVFGKRAVRETFHRQMDHFKKETARVLGKRPTLVGEFGIPFDLNDKEGYKTQDFSTHELALNRSFRAMESNRLSYTLWNYTPDNDNAHGDQWNGEDLSIFSLSQRKSTQDVNAGGRALKATIRAYPHKVAGEPLEYFFDPQKSEFYLRYQTDQSIDAPTEIFLPKFHYGKGFNVRHSPGKLSFDTDRDLLLFVPQGDGAQVLVIEPVKK